MISLAKTLILKFFGPALCCWLATTAPCAHGADAAYPVIAKIVGVTPSQDNVTPPSEIVFQFDKAVVPLGRMGRSGQEVRISFSPPLNCEWRWQSPTALACVLGKADLPLPATTYNFSVPEKFDITTSAVLTQPHSGSFTTSLPTISSAWFTEWSGPALPSIRLMTNQAVTQESLASHLHFEDARHSKYSVAVAEVTPSPDASEPPEQAARNTGRLWSISPHSDLPTDSALTLRISPGLRSLKGSTPGREERNISSFHTFPDFSFIGITCRDIKGNSFLIKAGDTLEASKKSTKRCDPLNAIQLTFNAPIRKERVVPAISSQPDLRGGRTDFDPWETTPSYSQLAGDHVQGQHYFINLPYGLKADTTYTFSAPAGGVYDEFNRTLTKDLSISFKTDNRPARYVLDHRHSVLEKDTDSHLPLVVNNVDSLALSYQTLTTRGAQLGLVKTLTPFKAPNIAYPFPIKIRDMLGGSSGIVQGTITAKPAQRYDNIQRFFSQVTPYAVHAKMGHFDSLIWVTSMASGSPVPNARVSVVTDKISALSPKSHSLASTDTDANGTAVLPGMVLLDPQLNKIDQWEESKPSLFIKVEKDGDLAVVPLTWDYQVYDGEIYPSTHTQYGHIHTWGTTAQGLYRLGDTVQFALWVRDQNNKSFTSAPREGYSLEVKDPTDKVVFSIPKVTLSEFGGLSGEFTTSNQAAVGWYTFVLKATFADETWEPLRVLISDFTPAAFKVTTDLQSTVFRAGDRVSVKTEARLHAGGPYAEAATRVTARLIGSPIAPKDPRAKNFTFSSALSDKTVSQQEELLNTQGDLVTSFDLAGNDLPFGHLMVESAVRDDRGKFVTSQSKVPFIGRSRFVGVKQDDWILSTDKEASVSALVVDDAGELVNGYALALTVEYEEIKVARVKSAGNAYTNRYEKIWVVAHKCQGVSSTATFSCSFKPQNPGRYRATARIVDIQGREHTSSIERWATGPGNVVWQNETSNQLQIIPEKTTYRVGEVARFMIQNPFPVGHALLTVERYGVQKFWNKTLTDTAAVFEVPITPDHIPGFFFSATVMSPRVDKPVDGQVDLGKPTFRIGYAQIDVDDPAKQLVVNVRTEKKDYKPNDTVTVDLSVTPGIEPVAPVEFAVTVIDESVFDLISSGRTYFDPYKGFYSLDGLDIKNYNLLKMLIGRQHFEKKGASPGGDGGSKLDMRSVKKYVSYWNPALRADPNGRASFSFQAPDNLTGWKVLAMALTPEDKMGLGDTRFVVNKDTEVRSAMPNQVRSGDSFSAIFTVMNRTDKPRTLNIESTIQGHAVTALPLKLSLLTEPFKRYPVSIKATAVQEGTAQIQLKAFDSIGGDSLGVSLPILPRTVAQTAVSIGSSSGATVTEPVQVPLDIDLKQGSIGAVISSSLLGGLDGAFAYMRDYPYECWEQKISKALMAAYALELRPFLPKSFVWPSAKDTITQTLAVISKHQAPNGGMAFYSPLDEHVSPYLSAFTALALNWLEELGYSIPDAPRSKLTHYLETVLRNEISLSPGPNNIADDSPDEMRATVRAVALTALAKTPKRGAQSRVNINDLHRISPKLSTMGLFGRSLYLQAALALGPSAKSAWQESVRRILASGVEANGEFALSDPQYHASPWLLDSDMRSQCAALDALISFKSNAGAEDNPLLNATIEKLARALALDRKRKSHWTNTQENLFCVRALASYAKNIEGRNAGINVDVAVGSKSLANLAIIPSSSEPVEVSRPLEPTDPGNSIVVSLKPSGSGRFYYSTRLTYAPKEQQASAINAGMEIIREFAVKRNGNWTALNSPINLKRGELVTINIFVRVSTPRYFVVLNDPIPGGLEPVNRDLATSSTVDTEQDGFAGPVSSLWFTKTGWIDFAEGRGGFYHRELRHSSARFYSEYLAPGDYYLSYVAQAIAPGNFAVPPAHSEAMYDPSIFGESSSSLLVVEE
jgi:uncharacterized protein YfaS (alpha-2-macroglobulin family)